MRVRGTSFSFGVLYKHSQQHRLAKGARVWVKVRDRSGLRSRSVVDLREVDRLVVDVRLDMDELTTIGLSIIETLSGLPYPTRHWIWALEVKAFKEARYRCSSLGCRVRVDLIDLDYE